MLSARWTFLGAAFVFGVAAHGTSLSAQDAKMMPLKPLSYQDEQSTQETGCTFTFSAAKYDYLQLVTRELLLRDQHGLRRCILTEAGAENLAGGKGTVSCSGHRLQIKAVGRSTSYAVTDSSSRRAVLTIDRDGLATRMPGIWAVAC